MTARNLLSLAPLALALLAAHPAIAQDAVGQITSVSGSVQASGPGGARSLSCGDTVYAGDTVSTGAGSSAGILMDDVLARVDAGSDLTVGRTPAGTPDAELGRGRVRVIDARDGGAPAQLGARDARVRVVGNDAEAYVLTEKVGPYAMFCEWDAPLAVSRGGETQTADPESCVIAKDSEPLYVADAHEERIPASGGAPCPPDLGALAAPGPHFSPIGSPDVAAGPPERWSSLARGIAMPARGPCDDPGSGCAAVGLLIVQEPPPGGGGLPGGD